MNEFYIAYTGPQSVLHQNRCLYHYTLLKITQHFEEQTKLNLKELIYLFESNDQHARFS